MNRIHLDLPDTPEMWNLLLTLAVHCTDDNIPFVEAELEDGSVTEETAKAQTEANEAFSDAVTQAMHLEAYDANCPECGEEGTSE